MTDKPHDVGIDTKSQSEKDLIDYNHELAGGGNGRIERFSIDVESYRNTDSEKNRKAKERRYTDMLSYMLAQDMQYRALYFELETKLDDAQSRVDEALLKIRNELDDIKYRLENADKLGLSKEQRLELERRREELRLHQEKIRDYQRDVLDNIRTRLDDKDNPPSKEDLDTFQDRIIDEMPDSLNALDTNMDAGVPSVASKVGSQPELSLVTLCDDFCVAHNNTNNATSVLENSEPNFKPLVM
jgi:hypothetical protein